MNKKTKCESKCFIQEGKLSPGTEPGTGPADWEYAHSELLEREGVDLKLEMEQKMREMEEQWRKEKEEATQAFQQERKKYEDQIESLQKQVGQYRDRLIQTSAPPIWICTPSDAQ